MAGVFKIKMATKDWKKNRKGGNYFSKKDNWLLIWNNNKNWFVRVGYKNEDWDTKDFESRTKALKFAKAYMRKH